MTRFTPSMRKGVKFLALLAVMFLFAACAGDAELDTRSNLAGPEAQSIESFMRILLWITYVVFAIIMGLTLWCWFKYRIKTDDYEDDEFPAQIDHSKWEIVWTIVPALILVVVFVFTLGLHQQLNSADENPISLVVGVGAAVEWEPEIVVVGQQWWWEYQYHFGDVELTAQRVETLPDADITTATQMVIPVGT